MVVIRLTVRLMGLNTGGEQTRWTGGARAWSLTALAAGAALWLDPVRATLGYGQIDLLIVALIMFDLTREDTFRGRGVATGIAAGLKLTPLIFVATCCSPRQRRPAVVAITVFLATVAAGVVLLPHDASQYWVASRSKHTAPADIRGPKISRFTGPIARLVVSTGPHVLVASVAAFVAAVGITVAVTAAVREYRANSVPRSRVTLLVYAPISSGAPLVWRCPRCLCSRSVGWERRMKPLLAGAGTLAIRSVSWPAEARGSRVRSRPLSRPSRLADRDPYVILGLLAGYLPGTGAIQLRRSRSGARAAARQLPTARMVSTAPSTSA